MTANLHYDPHPFVGERIIGNRQQKFPKKKERPPGLWVCGGGGRKPLCLFSRKVFAELVFTKPVGRGSVFPQGGTRWVLVRFSFRFFEMKVQSVNFIAPPRRRCAKSRPFWSYEASKMPHRCGLGGFPRRSKAAAWGPKPPPKTQKTRAPTP